MNLLFEGDLPGWIITQKPLHEEITLWKKSVRFLVCISLFASEFTSNSQKFQEAVTARGVDFPIFFPILKLQSCKLPWQISMFPANYHQNGSVAMAMSVLGRCLFRFRCFQSWEKVMSTNIPKNRYVALMTLKLNFMIYTHAPVSLRRTSSLVSLKRKASWHMICQFCHNLSEM